MQGKCEACGVTDVVDRAHIKTRGSGAGWEAEEWMPLCRRHHIEQGQIGWFRFTEKYCRARFALQDRGWKIENIFGQWKVVKK